MINEDCNIFNFFQSYVLIFTYDSNNNFHIQFFQNLINEDFKILGGWEPWFDFVIIMKKIISSN